MELSELSFEVFDHPSDICFHSRKVHNGFNWRRSNASGLISIFFRLFSRSPDINPIGLAKSSILDAEIGTTPINHLLSSDYLIWDWCSISVHRVDIFLDQSRIRTEKQPTRNRIAFYSLKCSTKVLLRLYSDIR